MPDQPALSEPSKIYRRIGGALCLDFCNTVGGTREGVARENLHSYAHLISWSEQAGLVSKSQASELNKKATQNPPAASLVLLRALELREAIYRVFFAIANQHRAASSDLAVINEELAKTLGGLRISPASEKHGFTWTWASETLDLDYPLGPLAHSAANLLISTDCCAHVRQCRGDNCGWLFLDSSKNHSRCWCDMRDCGNRAKVRRHRQKKQVS